MQARMMGLLVCVAFSVSTASAQEADGPVCDATNYRPVCSAPGTELRLIEGMRQRVNKDVVVGYNLAPNNIPGGKIYGVWHKPTVGDPFLLMAGFTPDSSGVLVCADSTTAPAAARAQNARMGWCTSPLASVGFSLGQFARAEPYRLALISTDDSVRVFGEVIPHPLEARNGACTLAAEMGTSSVFVFRGSGFRPGESVESVTRSGATLRSVLTADSAGTVGFIVVAAVPGKRGGNASQELKGAGCSVKLEYGWGDKTLKP